MKYKIIRKSAGVISTLHSTKELSEVMDSKSIVHLCSKGCENCYANKCKKVFDVRKKTIDKYDFVTDGFQFIDETGFVNCFFVNGCSNYVGPYKENSIVEEEAKFEDDKDNFFRKKYSKKRCLTNEDYRKQRRRRLRML